MKFKKPSKVELKPLTHKELPRYVSAVAILLQLTHKDISLLEGIGNRISEIWTKSGVTFTIQYLTECLRLVGNFLAGKGLLNHKTWVSTYKNGLPKILGLKGKGHLESLLKDLETGHSPSPVSRALISILSSFRAMSPKVNIPKFSTITDPFIGQSRTLPEHDLIKALNSLGALTYFRNRRLKAPSFFLSYKGGVNASVAILSVGLDLVALMRSPVNWLSMVRFSLFHRFYWFTFVMIVLSIILLPLVFVPLDLYIGRLGIIKELRGKTRVVGITDQWTQWLLKPLHDELSSFLGTLPTDGTLDQHGPVKRLLDSGLSEFWSVDLSAATDRLPVDIQEDILNLLGLNGSLWRKILRRPYYYDGLPLVYSVGQPMGAYSSFAMLALTNHVIMAVAMISSGITYDGDKPLYAILGDDVAIANKSLADNYIRLMDSVLGVVINPIKGFEGKLIEFAKNWFYKGGINLSPLGSKALLRSIRNPLFITSVIADYNLKQYPASLKLELQVLTKFLRKIHQLDGLSSWKWLFSILGPQSGFWSLRTDSNLDINYVYTYIMPMEAMFKDFLSQIGVSMSQVTMEYYSILTKKTWTPIRSFSDQWIDFKKLLKVILRPWIWSKNKFKALGVDPRYTAVLATASLSLVIIPVLTLKLIKNLLVISRLYLLSLVSSLLGFQYVHNSIINRIYWYIGNTIKRVGHWTYLTRDRVRGGRTVVDHPFRKLVVPRVPSQRVLESAISFDKWMRTLKFDRPIQFLVDRIRTRTSDELPAVKTAERVLSLLNSDYYLFNKRVKEEQKKVAKTRKNTKSIIMARKRKSKKAN